MKLDLGSGWENLIGYVNCDINKEAKPDIVLDFNETLPFKDNSFDEVLMSHSLEHAKNVGFTLSECFRVAPTVKIRVPSPRSPGYSRKPHKYLFKIHGLRGRHLRLPQIIQKLLGKFIPTEYVIEIRTQ